MNTTDKRTIGEREFLFADRKVNLSAFAPRHIESISLKRKPKNVLDIECNHILRTSFQERAHQRPLLPYALWHEAGKLDPPLPNYPDRNYDSNLWRNFTRSHNLDEVSLPPKSENVNISQKVAAMYPINIPVASRQDGYTYSRFLSEVPNVIPDPKLKQHIIKTVDKDLDVFNALRLRSEMRSPPIDARGAFRLVFILHNRLTTGVILPPRNYKRYEQRAPPEPLDPTPPQLPSYVDVLGQRIPRDNYKPFFMPPKLTTQQNNPKYAELMDALEIRYRARLQRLRQQRVNVKTFPPPQSP